MYAGHVLGDMTGGIDILPESMLASHDLGSVVGGIDVESVSTTAGP